MAKAPAIKKATNLPAMNEELETLFEGAGTGLENVTGGDLIIPRMTILQGLSPQLQKTKAEYDEDARVGQIYDVGLKEPFGDELHFLPVHFFKQWLEWAPRSTGKGLVTIHTSTKTFDEYDRNDKGVPISPDGNTVQETFQFFGFNLDAQARRTFIPFASTQIKKAKHLLTLATGEKITGKDGVERTPPLFYRSYNLSTVPESNNEGDWIGWKIERGPRVDELPNFQNLARDIVEFREQVSSGTVVGDVADLQSEAGGGAAAGGKVIDNEGAI